VEPQLQTVVAIIGAGTSILATLLGFLFDRSATSGLMVGALAVVASGLCFLSAALGGWIGLLIAILLLALLARRVGRGLGQERGSILVPALWLGYCASCVIGFWVGNWPGLALITLPAWLTFWGALFGLSRYLLPIADDGPWGRAFRSLLTFSLGTNYPYRVLEDRELMERVPGRAFLRLFAGPGIVLTGAAHVPIVWDGVEFKDIGQPGLTFTGQREVVYQTMDLRPQLRAFPVEAITKDGIRIRVLIFFPFKLAAGGRKPEIGQSFPLEKASLLSAAQQQLVEKGQKILWDETVRIVATQSLRKIISEYKFDELCASDDGTEDPRMDIRDRLVREVRQEVAPRGIHIIGGGIGNLEPEDWSLIDKRIDAWQAEWERWILSTKGQARATEIKYLEGAYIGAHRALLRGVREEIEKHPDIDPDLLSQLVALRFVESIEEFACNPEIQKQVPDETAETLSFLHTALKG